MRLIRYIQDDHFTRGYRDGLDLLPPELTALPQLSTEPWPGCEEGEDAADHWCSWLDSGEAMSLEQVEDELERAPDAIRNPDHPNYPCYLYWLGVAQGLRERRRQAGEHGEWEARVARRMLEMREAGADAAEIADAIASDPGCKYPVGRETAA